MPCLSGRYDPRLGLLLPVGVLAPGSVNPNQSQLTGSLTLFLALIDTGATTSCISPAVATQIGLKPSGMRLVASATHSVPMNIYLVDLVFTFGQVANVRPAVETIEFAVDASSPFQMLLGRDVLCTGVFTMSHDGHFTFSL